jgi:aquaporin Z
VAKYLTEFIGTFFLVLTIGLTVLTDAPMAALAIGASLMIMVYMGGHISGGHYNPAVSLALLLRGKLPGSEFVPYVLAQVAGALVASFTVYAVLGKTFAPAPGDGVGVLSVVLLEALYTFALALVVLNCAASEKTKGNSYYGLAIGFTIVVAAFRERGAVGRRVQPGCRHRADDRERTAGRRHVGEPVAVHRGAARRRGAGVGGLRAAGRRAVARYCVVATEGAARRGAHARSAQIGL